MTMQATRSQETTKPKIETKTQKNVPGQLVASRRGGRMLKLRSRLGFSQVVFSRMLSVSTRSLASIEGGDAPSETIARKLIEVQRIVDALSEVITPEIIGEWLKTPNDAFDGHKPLEIIERGEVDRIWQMIFMLRSGTPG
jgi:DNA-binding transcriptional regulator YiaG